MKPETCTTGRKSKAKFCSKEKFGKQSTEKTKQVPQVVALFQLILYCHIQHFDECIIKLAASPEKILSRR